MGTLHYLLQAHYKKFRRIIHEQFLLFYHKEHNKFSYVDYFPLLKNLRSNVELFKKFCDLMKFVLISYKKLN